MRDTVIEATAAIIVFRCEPAQPCPVPLAPDLCNGVDQRVCGTAASTFLDHEQIVEKPGPRPRERPGKVPKMGETDGLVRLVKGQKALGRLGMALHPAPDRLDHGCVVGHLVEPAISLKQFGPGRFVFGARWANGDLRHGFEP